MFYDFALTIPAGTPEGSYVEQRMKLTHGVVHRVEVEFAPGCRRYVYVKIYHGGHQLLPTNPEQSFRSDGHVIVIDEHYPLTSAPYELIVRGFSPDAVYPHTIIVRVGILPEEILLPSLSLSQVLRVFIGRLFGGRV